MSGEPDLLEWVREAAAGARPPLLSDGATGTELQKVGVEPGACLEALNVERPDVVAALHRRYLDAGAELLTTNSFGGMRLRLALHGREDEVVELNRAAARLAREAADAADRAVPVLGDVGPTGSILEPLGHVSEAAAREAFSEQIEALLAEGVDAVLVETMTAVEEMRVAVEAALELGAPLVIASFAFDRVKSGVPRTMMGVDPVTAARAAEEAGAHVVGCNCGTNLTGRDYADIVRALADGTDLPLLAQPNAGLPELTARGVVYRETSESMARTAGLLVDAGAVIVGGCCGSAPEHIAAFREMVG